MKSVRILRSKLIINFLLLAGLCATAGVAAASDCRPSSLVARAVGGEVLNQVLGGFNNILGKIAGVQNGVSPTPSSAMTDCILPAINPPSRDNSPYNSTPITSSPPRAPSFGWGDPHLVTHDGLGYDFQGAGDYAYVQSDELIIQARQVRLSQTAKVSRIKAYAVRAADTTLVFNDPIDPSSINPNAGLDALITVNGVDMPIGLGGWIDLGQQGSFIQRYRAYTYVHLVNRLDMLISHDGNSFQLFLHENLRGKVSGLLGNFDGNSANDLVTSTGQLVFIDDIDTVYGSFLTSWLRTGDASLFNSPYNPDIDGAVLVTDLPQVASRPVAEREAAAQLCVSAGALTEFMLQGCIYDALFDSDAEQLPYMPNVYLTNTGAIPARSLSADFDANIALDINAIVAPGRPSSEAGQLLSTSDIDNYTVVLPEGTQRSLNWSAPCSTAPAFSLTIESESAHTINPTLLCNAPIWLPSGAVNLRIFSQIGAVGDYQFELVESAITDLGTLSINVPIQGTLSAAESLLGLIPGNMTKYFIASNQGENCEREWHVIDANNKVLRRNSVCNDLGLFTTQSDTPNRLRILSGSSQNYAFTLLSVGADSLVESSNDRVFTLVVNTPGQNATASFQAAQNERLYIDRSGGVISGTLSVTNSSSEIVAQTVANEEDLTFIAAQDGIYSLKLTPDRSFAGSVPITIITIADDTDVQVVPGNSFTLTVSTLGQKAFASFVAVAGESFTIVETDSEILSGIKALPYVQTPDEGNNLVIFGSRTFTAEVTGTYHVVLESSGSTNFIGSLSFELLRNTR